MFRKEHVTGGTLPRYFSIQKGANKLSLYAGRYMQLLVFRKAQLLGPGRHKVRRSFLSELAHCYRVLSSGLIRFDPSILEVLHFYSSIESMQ